MKLRAPFIQLPLLFDAAALAHEIAQLGEACWRPHPQGFKGNSMLPLVAAHGQAANESFGGPMRPTPELLRCPKLTEVFAALGATVGRSRLMRLSGQAEVTRHADQGYYWADRVRVHVPIVTQPTVRFECGDATINMAAGECWIFDTWRQHRVHNDAAQARIHLVVDTVGGAGFWDMVQAGRLHSDPGGEWRPRPVPAGADRPVSFPCESVNLPEVMSPWELKAHFSLLFADLLPHRNAADVERLTGRFLNAWQGLWFEHGTALDARPVYRRLLQDYLAEVKPISQPLLLKNELPWFSAVMTLVARCAVNLPPAGASVQVA